MGRLLATTLCLLSVGLTQTASGASFDPDLIWHTIDTEHFAIHFHQGEEALADDFADTIEDVYDVLSERLDWQPKERTEIVLIDRTDDANGYARSIPYNAIVIYVTAPREDSTLNLYEDWHTSIATHELTHVLHMDTNRGLVRAARSVIGRIASTNSLSPGWIIEGLATYEETEHTPGGRGRGAWADMIKRATVLDNGVPPLGNLDGFQPMPPGGNLRYLFGQDFIAHIADRREPDVWTKWTHTYGGGLPYLLPAKKVFGASFRELYREWGDAMTERYEAQRDAVVREGATTSVTLSDPEQSCVAPTYSPNGEHIVWSCYDLRTGSALWHAEGDGSNPEILLQDRGASRFAWRKDSRAFAYAGSHLVNRFNVFSDLYLYTLGQKNPVPLTQGARARDPAFSPDGSELWMVTNRAGRTSLEVQTVDQRRVKRTQSVQDEQYSTPQPSPDGAFVAVSLWEQGRRDLWLLRPDGSRHRRLMADTAIDADPHWTQDGRWLFFTSDRSGVPNIYAIERATEQLFQVTNVITGAAKPSVSPDGQTLVYQEYRGQGWTVQRMALDPTAYLPRGRLHATPRWNGAMDAPWAQATPNGTRTSVQAESTQPTPVSPEPTSSSSVLPFSGSMFASQSPEDVLQSFDDSEIKDLFGRAEDYTFQHEVRPYSPWKTLLPRFVSPYIQTTPFAPRNLPGLCLTGEQCYAWQASLSTGSADTLSRYAWSAFLRYRNDADAWAGGASLILNRWLPVYTLSASTRPISTGRYAALFETEDGDVVPAYTEERYWEQRSTSFLQVSFPYRLRSTVFAQYTFTQREALDAIPDWAYRPALPLRGTTGAISAGYRYAWSQPTALSISREDGRIASALVQFLHPWLGTHIEQDNGTTAPLTQVQFTGDVRSYIVTPWLPNHVIAGHASVGAALGGTAYLGNYQIGGAIGDGAFFVTPDEFRMLRGYPFGYDIGDMYWLTGLEYRFPIWHIHRGAGTLPLYLRSLSGTVFADAGNAFEAPDAGAGGAQASDFLQAAAQRPLVGVGAEVSLGNVVGYRQGLMLRAGIGCPLTERNELPAFTPYVQAGGSF